MDLKNLKPEAWEYLGSKVATEPGKDNTIRVYVDNKMFARGPTEMIRYFFERAKAYIEKKRGLDI